MLFRKKKHNKIVLSKKLPFEENLRAIGRSNISSLHVLCTCSRGAKASTGSIIPKDNTLLTPELTKQLCDIGKGNSDIAYQIMSGAFLTIIKNSMSLIDVAIKDEDITAITYANTMKSFSSENITPYNAELSNDIRTDADIAGFADFCRKYDELFSKLYSSVIEGIRIASENKVKYDYSEFEQTWKAGFLTFITMEGLDVEKAKKIIQF